MRKLTHVFILFWFQISISIRISCYNNIPKTKFTKKLSFFKDWLLMTFRSSMWFNHIVWLDPLWLHEFQISISTLTSSYNNIPKAKLTQKLSFFNVWLFILFWFQISISVHTNYYNNIPKTKLTKRLSFFNVWLFTLFWFQNVNINTVRN